LKNKLPYLLAAIIAIGIIALLVTGNNKAKRKIDQRVTLKKKDKIPYGTQVAFSSLKYLFPDAQILTSREEPGYWDSLSNYEEKQAYIVITDRFTATTSDLKKLIRFAENGNDVFVSARYISSSTDDIINANSTSLDYSLDEDERAKELTMSLNAPPFSSDTAYKYPGKSFDSYFTGVDTTITNVLGFDKGYRTSFIHLKAGRGNFFIHLEPLAFSNYFLLYDDNIAYYEKAMSVIAPDTRKIVWDEYFINKGEDNYNNPPKNKKSWMSVFFSYPSLRAALLTAIFGLLLYVLLGMRRKQRYVPVVKAPRNDSLEFVKTIGRLYYDKGNHRNLAVKMSSYFLEHVRSKYKLPTNVLDEEFIKALQYKSGAEEFRVRSIVSFIKYLNESAAINEHQLADYHKELEQFYATT
jgi:hypothetical protein